ncbi:Pacs-1 domain containing protein [Trichuris trichiura]|uniref:Pacs-1 domain containing protein n=1 Tax=Trichuris trichiura TaxID=36087 RepID=A0A077YXR5_TRITR|nr:Pacs-1 domain containing protein [Trichuris trichiura]
MEQSKIVPMRLFATWEVDRACSNCVPRLCCLSFNRLTIFRSLEQGATNLVIAVKLQVLLQRSISLKKNLTIPLQGFKRTLRSNDMPVVPVNGIVDVDLDVEFTLQAMDASFSNVYPHFVKKQNNRLLVMLQRRKKYKNRPMLGYKTLAVGAINLTDELRRFLRFYKALDFVNSLCTAMMKSIQQSAEYSDDDDEDWTGNEEGGASDSEPIVDEQPIGVMTPSNSWLKSACSGQQAQHSPVRFALHQKNIKQKFISLLKKFRVPEEESTEGGFGKKPAQQELEALFEELDSLTDSGGEQENDTASLRSTPKPSLRTYFSSREKLPIVQDEGSDESKDSAGYTASCDIDSPRNKDYKTIDKDTLPECLDRSVDADRTVDARFSSVPSKEWSADPASIKGQRPLVAHQNSAPIFESRKLVKSSAMATTKDLPSASTASVPCIPKSATTALQLLETCKYCCLVTETLKETKSVFFALVGKIQRFCNQNSASPSPIQLCLLGGDEFFSNCLRSYTEVFGQKPNDWLGYVRFYPVACCSGIWLRYLSSMDRTYFNLFGQSAWLDLWDKAILSESEGKAVLDGIHRYLDNAKLVLPMVISEVMIHLKSENSNNELTQQFVPFVVSVKLAPVENAPEATVSSSDIGNVTVTSPTAAQSTNFNLSTSAVNCGRTDFSLQSSSPPGSPHSNELTTSVAGTDAKELQIEYWTSSNLPFPSTVSSATPSVPLRQESMSSKREIGQSGNQAKCTMKTAFRSLSVTKSAPNPVVLLNESSTLPLSLLAFHFVKERKKDKGKFTLFTRHVADLLQKLGMKNKDKLENEPRTHTVDGISRFICSTRQNSRINLRIDGVEWKNVKFFQISALWQTHVKFFPVGVFQLDTVREST